MKIVKIITYIIALQKSIFKACITLQLLIINSYATIINMIQLITSISEEISYYVEDNLTEKVNILLKEMKNNNSYNMFNIIDKKELELTNKYMEKVKIVSLHLDYDSIDYVSNLGYIFNVPEFYIYDIAYRKVVESLNCFKLIT